MDLIFQSKDKECLNEHKNKTHIYAAYRNHFKSKDT